MSSFAYLFFGGLEENTAEENRNSGKLLLTCSGPFWMFAGLFFLYSYLEFRKDRSLRELADYLRLYRRIELSKLAGKLGKSEYEIEKILLKCIENGYINGHIDRYSGEFFLEGTEAEIAKPIKCPHCGGISTKVVMKGEVQVCEYCGAPLYPS